MNAMVRARLCLTASLGLALWALWPALACGHAASREDAAPAQAAADAQPDPLLVQVEQAIASARLRHLTARLHTPWQIMHGVLALGRDFSLKKGDQVISAAAWLSESAEHWKTPVFEVTPHGARARPTDAPGEFEGHSDQFLAILALQAFPPDQSLRAGEATVTIADMVRHAQRHVNDRQEPTFTLIALSHYLGDNARWTNKDGEHWSIQRLVRRQLQMPIPGGTCGGTHALLALAYARRHRPASGHTLSGVWWEADQTLAQYIAKAKAWQNDDGTFSALFFKAAGRSDDFDIRLETSGHMLEWLICALPRAELRQPWLRRGVAAVAKDVTDSQNQPVRCDALYHAVHALAMYRDTARASAQPVAKPAPTEPRTDAGGRSLARDCGQAPGNHNTITADASPSTHTRKIGGRGNED